MFAPDDGFQSAVAGALRKGLPMIRNGSPIQSKPPARGFRDGAKCRRTLKVPKTGVGTTARPRDFSSDRSWPTMPPLPTVATVGPRCPRTGRRGSFGILFLDSLFLRFQCSLVDRRRRASGLILPRDVRRDVLSHGPPHKGCGSLLFLFFLNARRPAFCRPVI